MIIFKKYFFTKIEDVMVFDKEKFLKFVSNKKFLPDSYTTFKNKIGLDAFDNLDFYKVLHKTLLLEGDTSCYL
jgi:adenine-specific DNA-methyltransferase